MRTQDPPRTKFKQNVDFYLTAEEQKASSMLWNQLMTGNFRAANLALDRSAPQIRRAVMTAIRMRNEDGHDHENPFV